MSTMAYQSTTARIARPAGRRSRRTALPSPALRAAAAGAPDPGAAPAASGAIRVLCVDDHAVLVEGLKARFAIDGRIEVVGRLPSAACLVDEVERLRPDVVLLDIEMPGPDAFEITDRLKRAHPKVRVVVLSAHIRDAFISAAFKAGVCAYYAKSDDLDDIVRGIHEVSRSRVGLFLLGPKVRERCRPITTTNGARAEHRDETLVMRASAPMTLSGVEVSDADRALSEPGKGFDMMLSILPVFQPGAFIVFQPGSRSPILHERGFHFIALLLQ